MFLCSYFVPTSYKIKGEHLNSFIYRQLLISVPPVPIKIVKTFIKVSFFFLPVVDFLKEKFSLKYIVV